MEEDQFLRTEMTYIYLGELKSSSGEDNLVYCHGTFGPAPFEGVSMEYLQGYIDGAVTGNKNSIRIKNGIPKELAKGGWGFSEGQTRCPWDSGVNPLSSERLEELLDGTVAKDEVLPFDSNFIS